MIGDPINIGNKSFPNRVVLQPMEGCDCNIDGSPSELTVAKYIRAAKSSAGLVWFEANAVCPEGRTNPRQMMLTEDNLPSFKSLLTDMRRIAMDECGIKPIFILQLTHSGRQSITPMIAYRHPIYEEKRPTSDENIVSDEYLDTLAKEYAKSARLAAAIHWEVFPYEVTRVKHTGKVGEPRRGGRVVNAVPTTRNKFYMVAIFGGVALVQAVKEFVCTCGEQVACKHKVIGSRAQGEPDVSAVLGRSIRRYFTTCHGACSSQIVGIV